MATQAMLKPFWLDVLAPKLRSLETTEHSPRLAIVGIGNELRGDDAAGIAFVRALKTHAHVSSSVLVIDAGAAPENYTGPLQKFKPGLVVLVDAAQMNEPPGTIQLLTLDEAKECGASTHTLSPNLFAQYLTNGLHCEILLLGIQPEDNGLCSSLSPRVTLAVNASVRRFAAVLALTG